MSKQLLSDLIEQRDRALLSLNYGKIMAYMRKTDPEAAERMSKVSKEVFWAAVHKARTGATNLPMEARSDSKFWLAQRGMQSLDDGDVPCGVPND